MRKKTLLRIAGGILLLSGLYELLYSGALATLQDCGLDFTCPLPDELVPIETVIVLFVLGVIAFLTSLTFERKPGD